MSRKIPELSFAVNSEEIAAAFKELATEVLQDLEKGVANLAAITHAKVLEDSQKELKSTRRLYAENLGLDEVAPGIWVVSLDEKAMFIEEGLEPNFDMKPGLLREGENGKNGRYRIIPFDHGKAPSMMTPAAQSIVNELKEKLRAAKIPFKKIEKNEDGSPRTGKLHSLDLGGPIPGRGNTPALDRVNIYQTVTQTGNVRRDITTFRTVTDKQTGKWIHPGLEKKQYLDKALAWAEDKWENEILPDILKKYE